METVFEYGFEAIHPLHHSGVVGTLFDQVAMSGADRQPRQGQKEKVGVWHSRIGRMEVRSQQDNEHFCIGASVLWCFVLCVGSFRF